MAFALQKAQIQRRCESDVEVTAYDLGIRAEHCEEMRRADETDAISHIHKWSCHTMSAMARVQSFHRTIYCCYYLLHWSHRLWQLSVSIRQSSDEWMLEHTWPL